jgi:hypothetical protein
MIKITPCVHSLQMQLDAANKRIAELEKALKLTNAELSGAIDQVNHFFEYHHPSNSLDEPEKWDKQTCWENQKLLEQGE